MNKDVARSFGALIEEAGVALRALYIIDDNDVVQPLHLTTFQLVEMLTKH